jgi:2-keto-3-deoxy-L-rhamnonate aldolase RhmA
MNEKLREKLRTNQTAYGLWVTSESTSIVEIATELDLDWVCIDMEHGYLNYQQVSNLLLAGRGSTISIFVRPPTHDLEPTKRVLDLGAHGIILPLVETADEVKACQQNMFYPPTGKRGIGGERNVSWGLNLQQYVSTANDEVMLLPMIETAEAYNNFAEIIAVPGIEAVFMGPGDMSASYGSVGAWEGPGVAEKILEMTDIANVQGIRTGIVATSTPDAVQRTAQGFGMVCLGSDVGLMIRQIKQMGDTLGKTTKGHRWF